MYATSIRAQHSAPYDWCAVTSRHNVWLHAVDTKTLSYLANCMKPRAYTRENMNPSNVTAQEPRAQDVIPELTKDGTRPKIRYHGRSRRCPRTVGFVTSSSHLWPVCHTSLGPHFRHSLIFRPDCQRSRRFRPITTNARSGAHGGIVQTRTEVDLILTDFDKDKRETIVSLPRKMLVKYTAGNDCQHQKSSTIFNNKKYTEENSV
ncbi:hypothetical protein J6590_094832 [Homalodisca vitripennis]|nr:hypothetical protein J6590_094832 [Homalodisca vitripennis]